MNPLEPDSDEDLVLQILHVSDLHLLGPAARPWYTQSQVAKFVDAIAARLPDAVLKAYKREILQGLETHDPAALDAFDRFVAQLTSPQLTPPGLETWLLDTGDLTTFGDLGSVKWGLDRLAGIARTSRMRKVSLYGNHDAWPGYLPVLAPLSDAARLVSLHPGRPTITHHRRTLREVHYRERYPQVLMRAKGPSIDVMLYGLNTVLHEPMRNTLALGEVVEDYYRGFPDRKRATPAKQIKALRQMVEAYRPRDGSRQLRLLATHHPVHQEGVATARTRVLANADEVGHGISQRTPTHDVRPPIHVVLSGHTHELAPAHGALPGDASSCDHPPLEKYNQCQLVVGSLSQRRVALDADDIVTGVDHHQCQLLRVYSSRADRRQVRIERALVAREDGLGEFTLMPTPTGSGLSESIRLEL